MCSHECIDCFLNSQKCHLSKREIINVERVLRHWLESKKSTCRQCHQLSSEDETFSLTKRELYVIFFFFATLEDCKNLCLYTTEP